MYSCCVKGVFYGAFVRKCTDMCKHRIGVQLLQNPPLCSSTVNILFQGHDRFRLVKKFQVRKDAVTGSEIFSPLTKKGLCPSSKKILPSKSLHPKTEESALVNKETCQLVKKKIFSS